MGIKSYEGFLRTLGYRPTTTPESFDSLLIDAQSLVYAAAHHSVTDYPDNAELSREIVDRVLESIVELLRRLMPAQQSPTRLDVVISFDGASVPMKYPLHRLRREKPSPFPPSLGGRDGVSRAASDNVRRALENFDATLSRRFRHVPMPRAGIRFVLADATVEGEGEQKLFYLADTLGVRCPLVYSVDNDVFLVSLMRVRRYDRIQVFREARRFYNVTDLANRCDLQALTTASLLFGNDFIPTLIPLSRNNFGAVHEALSSCPEGCDHVRVFRHTIRTLERSGKLRFERVPYVDRSLVVRFWTNVLWIVDYFTEIDFAQKYSENRLFGNADFDRNALLTALSDADLSDECRRSAVDAYRSAISHGPQKRGSDPVCIVVNFHPTN